jgi:hypothetical protein
VLPAAIPDSSATKQAEDLPDLCKCSWIETTRAGKAQSRQKKSVGKSLEVALFRECLSSKEGNE